MDEYIKKADAISVAKTLAALKKDENAFFNPVGYGEHLGADAVADALELLPAEDACEIVRCETCRSWLPEETVCKDTGICNEFADVTGKRFYCAYGRRKEDQTDGRTHQEKIR